MLEQLMHEAQMMKQQGKRIGQIAEALEKVNAWFTTTCQSPQGRGRSGIYEQARSIQTLHRQYTRGRSIVQSRGSPSESEKAKI
jgi:hypothetical protein